MKRGYNGTNAYDSWYTNAFYDAVNDDEQGHRPGGAIFVDNGATVNVKGEVYVKDNKQCLKIGDADAIAIESNVYLPTFHKSLTITGSLDNDTRIGVTSPRANDAPSYIDNTFSPVAVASNSIWASNAWDHLNFYDDLGWFFINENVVNNVVNHKRTAYYDGTVTTPQQPNPINANLN